MRITKLIVSLMLLALVAISFALSVPTVTWYPDNNTNPGPLPTYFSGTSCIVRFRTYYDYPGRTLSKITLKIGGKDAGTWTKPNGPTDPAFVSEQFMTVRFDSSEFPDGSKVKLKAVIETSGLGNPYPPGPYEYETASEIEIRNKIVYHEHPGLILESGLGQALCYLPNYTLVDRASGSTTRETYLDEIVGHSVIVALFHGGLNLPDDGFLQPPAGTYTIHGGDIQSHMLSSTPPSTMIYILACKAGGSSRFLQSYRTVALTPFAGFGFKVEPTVEQALEFFSDMHLNMAYGFPAYQALLNAWEDSSLNDPATFWELKLTLEGDFATTVKGVYLGSPTQKSLSWYTVLP